jgi:hypothetical protein
MAKKVINSFNAGELSPYMYARYDLDKYHSGCLTMENFVPLPYGGATRRPAIEYKFEADGECRIVPFIFSVDESYNLIITDSQIKVYADDTLKDTIVSPWATADLVDLKWVQSADVMWFTHPDHPVQRLERASDTSWSIADTVWDFPQLLDENEDDFFFDFDFSSTTLFSSPASYVTGDVRRFDGVVYKCIEDYSSVIVTDLTTTFYSDFNQGKWISSNEGETAVLNSYTTKDIATSVDADYFTADMVGSVFSIKNQRNRDQSIRTLSNSWRTSEVGITLATGSGNSGESNPVNVSFSNWEFVTNGNWTGLIVVQRSFDLISWEDYVFIGDTRNGGARTFSFASDGEEGANVWIRLHCEDLLQTASGFTLTVNEINQTGTFRIDSFVDANTVNVTVVSDIQRDLSVGAKNYATRGGSSAGAVTTHTRSMFWSEGAFSDYRGHPSSVAMFENRLCFAGASANPNRIWLSQSDDFQNFQISDIATGAIDITLNSGRQDEIKWLVPQEVLVIGTSGGEWALGPVADNQPVTPTGFNLKQKSTYGTSGVQALPVNNAVLFPMRQNRKIREWFMQYDTKEAAQDVTILSEHITNGGITQWDYQQQPDNILWSIRGDGTLLGFTYERDQNVTGWHRHNNDAFIFESVAVIPKINAEDEVWVSVKITVDGNIKRYIGKLDDREWGTDYTTDWRGSDLYTVFSSPGSATLTGLGYLEGKTVSVVADGVPKANAVVTSGEITVDSAAYTTVVVGLPFTATLAPIYLNSESQYGTSRGSQVGCSKAIIRFKDTYSASVGQSVSDVESVRFDGDDTALYNDDAEAYFDNGSDFLLTCYIVNSDQMPCTVLAMIPKLEVAR